MLTLMYKGVYHLDNEHDFHAALRDVAGDRHSFKYSQAEWKLPGFIKIDEGKPDQMGANFTVSGIHIDEVKAQLTEDRQDAFNGLAFIDFLKMRGELPGGIEIDPRQFGNMIWEPEAVHTPLIIAKGTPRPIVPKNVSLPHQARAYERLVETTAALALAYSGARSHSVAGCLVMIEQVLKGAKAAIENSIASNKPPEFTQIDHDTYFVESAPGSARAFHHYASQLYGAEGDKVKNFNQENPHGWPVVVRFESVKDHFRVIGIRTIYMDKESYKNAQQAKIDIVSGATK